MSSYRSSGLAALENFNYMSNMRRIEDSRGLTPELLGMLLNCFNDTYLARLAGIRALTWEEQQPRFEAAEPFKEMAPALAPSGFPPPDLVRLRPRLLDRAEYRAMLSLDSQADCLAALDGAAMLGVGDEDADLLVEIIEKRRCVFLRMAAFRRLWHSKRSSVVRAPSAESLRRDIRETCSGLDSCAGRYFDGA